MSINLRIVLSFFGAVVATLILTSQSISQDTPEFSAKQLVVMVDARFPTTGQLTSGAGIVVGRKGGLVYIATAAHVVKGLAEPATNIKVQFQDRPGDEIEATLWPSNFDKGVDLAVLVVPEDRAPKVIASADSYPAARMSNLIRKGEGAFLFGQPRGRLWSGSTTPEIVVATTSTSIEIKSSSVVPGMSGGAALDEGLRIVGLIVETENGVARAITLKYLKELLDSSGYPFQLIDIEGDLPDFIPNRGSERERLSNALSSGRFKELSRFPRNQKTAALVEAILVTDAPIRKRFFAEFSGPEEMLWLAEILKEGLDPNFIVDEPNGRSALYYALISNNVPLAIAFLKNGASPHLFQNLWGNETKIVSILHPLEWLPRLSASEEQKRNLAKIMADAGLAVLVRSPHGQYSFDKPDTTKSQRLLQYLGIPSRSVDALRRDTLRCSLASKRSLVDWCEEMNNVPTYIENITGSGDDLFEGFLIGKLISIYQDKMYFFALGANGHWAGHPPALAVISRGRDRVELYRYSRNAAGLGHCSRLRRRARELEPGDYTNSDSNAYCWRRAALKRTLGEPSYDHIWERSYYCRVGDVDNSQITVLKYPGRNWSQVTNIERMRGRVGC